MKEEFKCDQCGWTPHNKKFLTGHMTSHVAAERRLSLLKCKVCDFTSKISTLMNGHIAANQKMHSYGQKVENGGVKCMVKFKTQH